jgi:hypothetical protein
MPESLTLEEKLKDHRESAIRLMAILMCRAACIEPVDSEDGSPHWWIFAKEAEAIIDGIQKRFPPPVAMWKAMELDNPSQITPHKAGS